LQVERSAFSLVYEQAPDGTPTPICKLVFVEGRVRDWVGRITAGRRWIENDLRVDLANHLTDMAGTAQPTSPARSSVCLHYPSSG
jgi:hypothetical protein